MQESNNPNDVTNQHHDRDENLNHNEQSNLSDPSHPDGIFMQNGAIMRVKNGQTNILDQDFTFDNGAKIMRDGTYIQKNGSQQRLEEGEHLDTSGNLISSNEERGKITNQDREIPNKLNL